MLKTIKTTKQLRLDELIKYVWENNINEKRVFLGNHGQRVVFDNVGGFYPSGYAYSPDSTFTVEVEEEITEDTEFENIVGVMEDNFGLTSIGYSTSLTTSIKKFRESFERMDYKALSIYALIGDKLEIIYEEGNNGEE